MAKTVRVELSGSGFKRITMLPLNEESINTLKDHDMNAEEAFSDVWDQVWREDAGQLMDYIFAHAYSEIGLVISCPDIYPMSLRI